MCETRDLGVKWPHTMVRVGTHRLSGAQVTLKRCWCRGPDQTIGRSGEQHMNMKS